MTMLLDESAALVKTNGALWTWVAHMADNDGRTISELDDRPFADVLAGQCASLEFVALRPGLPSFAITLGPHERPWYKRTRALSLVDGQLSARTWHCTGFERDDSSPDHGGYLFWDDEGHVVASSDRALLDRLLAGEHGG